MIGIILYCSFLYKLGVTSARQIPVYARHKIAPAPNPPGLSATSNIPNVGGLVQNMNDLSAKTNLNASSCQSSNYSGDVPDSLALPAWPACSVSQRVKKLSWDDDDRVCLSILRIYICIIYNYNKCIIICIMYFDKQLCTINTTYRYGLLLLFSFLVSDSG